MGDFNSSTTNQQIFTVSQFVKANPWVTLGGLRFQLFRRKRNGLETAGVILKRGKRILIDGPKYVDWLRQQSTQSNN